MTLHDSGSDDPATVLAPARCAVWWADRQDDARWEQLLGTDELQRLARLSRADDRSRHATGRALLRLVLSPLLDLPPERVRIRQHCRLCGSTRHGKPEVSEAGMAVSITHAGDRIGVAVLDHGQVGLDAEALAQLPAVAGEDLASIALGPEEREAYDRLAAGEQARAVLSWWTRKEAVLKATGWGVAVPPDRLHVSAPGSAPVLLAWQASQDPPDEPTYLYEVAPGPGYIGCLAVLGRPATVSEHDGTALLRRFLARQDAHG